MVQNTRCEIIMTDVRVDAMDDVDAVNALAEMVALACDVPLYYLRIKTRTNAEYELDGGHLCKAGFTARHVQEERIPLARHTERKLVRHELPVPPDLKKRSVEELWTLHDLVDQHARERGGLDMLREKLKLLEWLRAVLQVNKLWAPPNLDACPLQDLLDHEDILRSFCT